MSTQAGDGQGELFVSSPAGVRRVVFATTSFFTPIYLGLPFVIPEGAPGGPLVWLPLTVLSVAYVHFMGRFILPLKFGCEVVVSGKEIHLTRPQFADGKAAGWQRSFEDQESPFKYLFWWPFVPMLFLWRTLERECPVIFRQREAERCLLARSLRGIQFRHSRDGRRTTVIISASLSDVYFLFDPVDSCALEDWAMTIARDAGVKVYSQRSWLELFEARTMFIIGFVETALVVVFFRYFTPFDW